jgi:hypothetical protein
MGRDGKGRPSDIIMVRWEASKNDKGNPYDIKYLATRIDEDVDKKIVDWQKPEQRYTIGKRVCC